MDFPISGLLGAQRSTYVGSAGSGRLLLQGRRSNVATVRRICQMACVTRCRNRG